MVTRVVFSRHSGRLRLGLAFFLATADELVDGPFGMDPAQRMEKNIELSGIVTEDHQLFRETMMQNAAEQRALRGDPDMAIFLDAQSVQMQLPVYLSRKQLVGDLGKPSE